MYSQSRKLLLASSIALAIASMGSTAGAETLPKDTVKAQDTVKGQEKTRMPASMDAMKPASSEILNARQETQIWTTYALSPYLRAHDIKVSVKDGKAILTGKVDEDVNKDLAKEIALGVDGIKNVDNQIIVQADYVPAKRSSSERSYGEVIDDASITAAVKSKLLWSKYAEGMDTEVETKSGKVTLKGTVHSKEAKDHAQSLAMNTRGVESVNNKLVIDSSKSKAADDPKQSSDISSSSGSDQVIADTWITTKVKSTYIYSSNIEGANISVDTVNGVVTLSGEVNSGAEKALAIEFAKNIRGVNSVNSKDLLVDNSVAGR